MKKKKQEDHAKFQQCNPFKWFPEYRCLSADSWREPYEAKLESQAEHRVSRTEKMAEFVPKAYFEDATHYLQEEVDEVHTYAAGAYNDLRRLEDRLQYMLGRRIPQLPLNYYDDEEDAWDEADALSTFVVL